MLGTQEVARILGVTPAAVWRLKKLGQLEREGRGYSEESVERELARREETERADLRRACEKSRAWAGRMYPDRNGVRRKGEW